MKKLRRHTVILTAVLLAGLPAVFTACTKTYSTATDASGNVSQTSQSLVDYLKNNYSFSMFYAALQKVGLDKQLTNDKSFTLLIPDNDAFTRAGISTDSLMAMDTAVLRGWMAYHIVKGAVRYTDVPQTVDNVYYTIDSNRVFFSKPGGASATMVMHINGDTVNNFDIKAFNGYIQVLNRPLTMPVNGNLQDYINANLNTFSLFKQALQKFGLWDSLKNTSHVMTVFAPVNAGFRQYDFWGADSVIINADTIANWDTSVVPKAVFGVYLMPSRIFSTDFKDLQVPYVSGLNYIFPGETSYLHFDGYGITGFLLNSGYAVRYRATINLLPPSNFITANGNCVLQPVDNVTMVP